MISETEKRHWYLNGNCSDFYGYKRGTTWFSVLVVKSVFVISALVHVINLFN